MTNRVHVFDCVVPAGTARSAPVTIDTSFPTGLVGSFELVIPDGCAGLVGVRVMNAFGQVIPYAQGTWIRGNDEVIEWPLSNYVQSGSWQLQAYNEDLYEHTLQVRYLILPAPAEAAPAARATPLEIVAFEPAGG